MKTSRRVRLMIVSHGRADGGAGATGANKGLGSSPFSKGLADSKGRAFGYSANLLEKDRIAMLAMEMASRMNGDETDG